MEVSEVFPMSKDQLLHSDPSCFETHMRIKLLLMQRDCKEPLCKCRKRNCSDISPSPSPIHCTIKAPHP